MNQNQKAMDWAIHYLTVRKQEKVINSQPVVETSYSIVYKIETTSNIFYLKITPESLFCETIMLKFLNEQGCQNIPKLITQDNHLNCFLTQSCGDESLRHLFNGTVDLNPLMIGINHYTTIQRSLEKDVPLLLSMNLPDWRLEKFPELYHELIQQNVLLISDGLTKTEIRQLHQLYPVCIKLCEELAAIEIPETLNHCDFHENNMLLDKKTGAINIIDWGEVVISHPFFSLNGCLWNITYFNTVKTTDPEYTLLQSHCMAAWVDDYKKSTLSNAFHLANRLLGIYAALGYQIMYLATADQFRSVQQEHHGAIAGCLRSFLSQNG